MLRSGASCSVSSDSAGGAAGGAAGAACGGAGAAGGGAGASGGAARAAGGANLIRTIACGGSIPLKGENLQKQLQGLKCRKKNKQNFLFLLNLRH